MAGKVLTVLLVAASAGCSTRAVYDGLRMRQEMDCQQLQGIDREQCLKQSGMSYDEYRKVREKGQREQ